MKHKEGDIWQTGDGQRWRITDAFGGSIVMANVGLPQKKLTFHVKQLDLLKEHGSMLKAR